MTTRCRRYIIPKTTNYPSIPNLTDGKLTVKIAGHSSTTPTIQARNDIRVVKIIQMEVFDLTKKKYANKPQSIIQYA